MTHRPFAEILDECLDRVLQRGETIEACVADYPEHAEELREALAVAHNVRLAAAFAPDADRKRAARLRFRSALERKQQRAWWRRLSMPRGLAAGGRRAVAAVGLLTLLFAGGGTGTALAAQGSVPGDVLYPVKRATERTRLAFTISDEGEARLRQQLMDRRLEEVEAVTARGRDHFVPELTGQIQRHANRARAIIAAPVSEAVAVMPLGVLGPPSGPGPTVAPGPQPTNEVTPAPPQRAAAVADEAPKVVPANRLLELNERLGLFQQRIEELIEHAPSTQAAATLKRLHQQVSAQRHEVVLVLQRADRLHQPADARTSDAPQVDGGASVAPRRPTPAPERPGTRSQDAPETRLTIQRLPTTDSARPGVQLRQVEVHLEDVRLVRDEGRVTIVLQVRINGDTRVVELSPQSAHLIKGGGPGRLQDLQPGAKLRIGVSPDNGQVVAVWILPD